jgi:hypothetical protein
MLSHWLGIIGESLNFLGALIMALDIFLRGHERRREKKLGKLAQFARENGLERTIYRGFRVTSADFPQNVLDDRATVIAYVGIAILAAGFLLLIGHHWLELRDYEFSRHGITCLSGQPLSDNRKLT